MHDDLHNIRCKAMLSGRHISSLQRKFLQFSVRENILNLSVNIIFFCYFISKYFNSIRIRIIF